MTRPRLSRTLRWHPLNGTGLEHLEIIETAADIRARSVIIGEFEGLAVGARYEIVLDTAWLFRSLTLERMDGMNLVLHSSGNGHWTNGAGQALPELNGCIDIDIGATPFTNTLPVRRAGLIENQPQTFSMAWIPLDTLVPFADGQIYTRLAADRYHYEAADGSFEADLTVDADGFVIHYPDCSSAHERAQEKSRSPQKRGLQTPAFAGSCFSASRARQPKRQTPG